MTAHPDLAALLRGDLSTAAALECAAHARACATCRDDLVDLALGHALLTAAARTLGPEQVMDTAVQAAPSPVTLVGSLPVPLQRELAGPRRLRVTAAVAAAVLVVAAAAATVTLGNRGEEPGPAVATEQTATLEPVEPGSAAPSGRVSMATDTERVTRMRVDTVDLPRPPRGGFYYVWLFDPASNKMLPLGQVVPGHRASFDVPAALVAAYSAVDVSLEADDGDPGHSVTSVLRASYDATDPVSGTATATPSGSS